MDKKTNKKLKTLDISTTLFDYVAFVFVHVMDIGVETFSEDFLEVRWLRSQGVQLLLHELQQRCGRILKREETQARQPNKSVDPFPDPRNTAC